MRDILLAPTPPAGQPPLTLAQYRQDPNSWGANAGGGNVGIGGAGAANTAPRLNPWHPRLDDIMFYL
jgi:hypothetical protein